MKTVSKDVTMQNPVSNEELRRMKARLDQEVIDDAEELLNWFGVWGSRLIDEVLTARKSS